MQSEQTLKTETFFLQTCLSEDRLFRARISSRELQWNGTPKYNVKLATFAFEKSQNWNLFTLENHILKEFHQNCSTKFVAPCKTKGS